MYNENMVFLVGNLGRHPELALLGADKLAKANFSIATNRRLKNTKGELEQRAEWHHVVAFGQNANFAAEHLRKGRLVRIVGHLQTREWEKNGETHFRTEIIADRIGALDIPSTEKALPETDTGELSGSENATEL